MRKVMFLLLIASVALNIYLFTGRAGVKGRGRLVYEDTVTYFDTVPMYYPVPQDSVVLRYVTKSLPLVKEDSLAGDSVQRSVTSASDSVRVNVPVMQKAYKGDNYRIYISGYSVGVDSMFIYPQKQVIRIRDEPKRFNFGLSAGYGMTPKGFQPYVGVSVTYSIFRF